MAAEPGTGPGPREERARPPGEGEGEAELCVGLARTRARSYGSTASSRAPLAPPAPLRPHRLRPGDTLQGLALRYGVTMEQIKRANKLFTNDCMFLKETLNIPVASEEPLLLLNGPKAPQSPEGESDSPSSCDEGPAAVRGDDSSPSPPQAHSPPPEDLSARDFLHRLDLQIKLSKQAARKLKPGGGREDDEENPYATSSYQQ